MTIRSDSRNTPKTGGGVPRAAAVAALVFVLTTGFTVLLALFVFRPLITPVADNSAGEGERFEKVDVYRGEIDSIDRPKFWGEGPVTGPAFAPQDQTLVLDIKERYPNLAGEGEFAPALVDAGFGVRIPWTWSCFILHGPETPYVGWYCAASDNQGAILDLSSRPLVGPGPARGFIALSPCRRGPCGPEKKGLDPKHTFSGVDENGRERKTMVPRDYTGRVREADSTTAYVEQTAGEGNGPRYLLSMDHFWRREGGRPDVRVAVTLSGPPEAEAEIQKIVNDLREATP